MAFSGLVRQIIRRDFKPRFRRFRQEVMARFRRHDLIALAKSYQTDKWNTHWYVRHYQRHVGHLRFKRLNILEIGIGGYEDPRAGGHSLRMWKAYFPHSQIYGIDIHDKTFLEEPRIKTFQGSQDDPAFLRQIAKTIGRLDIVVDDGSHVNHHALTAFETLFPLLSDHGIYVVEDTQASYWPGFGGDSQALNRPDTIMGYFKSLVDGLNYEERIHPGYQPSYFDRHIVAMHFYHNLVFICKGQNNEGSNFIQHNLPRERWVGEPPR